MMSKWIDDIDVMRFVFPYINSNMYVLLDGRSALVIDPHKSSDVVSLFESQQINDILLLLTHEHPDHTSGVNEIRQLAPTTLVCQQHCARAIANEKNNRPILISFILSEYDKKNQTQLADEFNNTFLRYSCVADITFENEYYISWHGNNIHMHWTPGHSKGSCVVIFNDTLLFSGDSLLRDVPVITRFPGGSIDDYNTTTLPFFRLLNKEMICFPGHGHSFRLGDVLDVI